MITFNDKEVTIETLSSVQTQLRLEDALENKLNEFVWNFESMEELFILIKLMSELKSTKVNLYLPYLPNARMDKIQNENEGFMLKYFVETLDNLGFNKIEILDPHSDVYKQWTKNTEWTQNDKLVKRLITCTLNIIKTTEKVDEVTLVYPDSGARSRYTSLIGANENLYGVKERCQATGKILSFDLAGNVPSTGPVLIVDDICSKGGTFYFTAKKLREKGFTGPIYLYVTHAEKTIQDGELLKPDSEIKRVFTTNSILNIDLNKTTIFML